MAVLITCRWCGKQLSSDLSSCPHCHEKLEPQQCRFCGKEGKESEIEIHSKLCQETFMSNHPDTQQFSCPTCHNIFKYKDIVIKSDIGEWSDDYTFKCPSCGQYMKFYKCNFCKQFYRKEETHRSCDETLAMRREETAAILKPKNERIEAERKRQGLCWVCGKQPVGLLDQWLWGGRCIHCRTNPMMKH